MTNCHLRLVAHPGFTPELMEIYHKSFPIEERRPDALLCQGVEEGKIILNVVEQLSERDEWVAVGFLTLWQLGCEIDYIEHFAISPHLRGAGLGSKALNLLTSKSTRGIVIEVEPAQNGDTEKRRIEFYRRCGFTLHNDFHYIQPPYGPQLPEVELKLMTFGKPDGLALEKITFSLHSEVYNRRP